MINSCGNCKYTEYRDEYLYPYRCKKEKAVSYSEETWMDRVRSGYVCKKWELKRGDKMTRAEAIDVLKHNYPSACFEDLCEAVEVAIQALSTQPGAKSPKWVAEDRYVKNHFKVFPHCPQCNAEVTTGQCYCMICGQDIDWSEDDE